MTVIATHRDHLRRLPPLEALAELGELTQRQRATGERFGRAFSAGALVAPWRRRQLPGTAARERLHQAFKAAGSNVGLLIDVAA